MSDVLRIMYRKCMTFADQTSADAIPATDDTAAQQKTDRKAKDYNGEV